jgi:hypothetical protein
VTVPNHNNRGVYTKVEIVGSNGAFEIYAINDSGVIAGHYHDNSGQSRGFIGTPATTVATK